MSDRQKKTSPIIIFIISLFFISIAGLIFLFSWWNNVTNPVLKIDNTNISIEIPKGYSSDQIAELLISNNLIKNKLAFKLMVKKLNLGSKLQAGVFEMSKSMDLNTIVYTLTTGKQRQFWITIPEGKRREEIAFILYEAYRDEGLNFSIPKFMQLTEGKEGYLFPDTYLITYDADENFVVKLLLNNFDEQITDVMKNQAARLDLSFDDIIVIASMVEREAKHAGDRSMIAGVMLNRLKINMPFQIDATIQYIVGEQNCSHDIYKKCDWWPVIYDTKYPSKYNTYQHSGLPPAPICNPGLAVIQAVLNPDQHNYLYYLSDESGKTYYAETLLKHEHNIEKYLK